VWHGHSESWYLYSCRWFVPRHVAVFVHVMFVPRSVRIMLCVSITYLPLDASRSHALCCIVFYSLGCVRTSSSFAGLCL
jgi:hypothetical protein